MRILLDSNVLLRICQPDSPHCKPATDAIRLLLAAKRTLCVSSQAVYEFLAVATRSASDNGLGMSHTEAIADLTKLIAGIELFYDSEAIVKELQRLVLTYSVTGKKVHDGRLVATMLVNGVKEILTFNAVDFRRYSEIVVIEPLAIVSGL